MAKISRLPGLVTVALIYLALSFAPGASQTSTEVHTTTIPQINTIEDQKASRTAAQQKMSSQLIDSLEQTRSGRAAAGVPSLMVPTLPTAPEGVVVDIRAKVSPTLLDEIAKSGGTVINSFPQYDSVRAAIPIEGIEPLASHSDVKFIEPAAQGHTNAVVPTNGVGSTGAANRSMVATEGDIAHMAKDLRDALKVRGAGIRIGVLSDSIDDARGSLQKAYDSGALDPKAVTIIPGQQGAGVGEGLAMLEIIHAIAPDASLYFATANGGPANMASNIVELKKSGCDIIVDDFTYFVESPFQEGFKGNAGALGLAVSEVSAAGVLYFSAAGNAGNQRHKSSGTWEGDFSDGGPAGLQFSEAGPNAHVHMFAQGFTLNTLDKANKNARVDLFWADQLGGSANEYDLFVVNAAGQVVRSSTTSHDGSQDPYQAIVHVHQGESVVIVKSADAAPRFLHLEATGATLRHYTGGSVRGHNASGAPNAFSVAARRVPVPAAPFRLGPNASVEIFSSDGPRRIFFTADGNPITPGNFSSSGGMLLIKPDLTAADRVSTTLPKDPLLGLNPFAGTSAAAPHAAGIAALLLSCSPRPKPSQVRAALFSAAEQIEGNSANGTAGHGVIMALAAAKNWCHSANTASLPG